MATLNERLKLAHDDARRRHDKVEAALLGTILGAITTREKNHRPQRTLDDGEITLLLRSFGRDIAVTAEFAAAKGRADGVERARVEAAVIAPFLSAQMGEAEIELIVRERVAQGEHGLGPIMTHLKVAHAGRYDASRAVGVIRRVLA